MTDEFAFFVWLLFEALVPEAALLLVAFAGRLEAGLADFLEADDDLAEAFDFEADDACVFAPDGFLAGALASFCLEGLASVEAVASGIDSEFNSVMMVCLFVKC